MKRVIILPLILISLTLFASPIGERRAREIAKSFFVSNATTRGASTVSLDLVWTGGDSTSGEKVSISRTADGGKASEDALIYVYNSSDIGGFVVVAGDDNVKHPIIAFSYDNSFDAKDMADGAKGILLSWCEQIKVARLSKSKISHTTTRNDTSVGEVLCKYETASWGQSDPFNLHSPEYDGVKTAAGCVATAMAILCYYHKWPNNGVGITPEYTFKDSYDIERTIPANELGRTYDYSNMLSKYLGVNYTESQARAVADLMYDLGTSVEMKYKQSGSSAYSKAGTKSMMEYFGYSKGAIQVSYNGYTHEEWVAILQNNLKEYGPTRFSGSSDSGSHAFILDGCTDAGYFSINYGWNGGYNGYYLLPDIEYYKSQAAELYLVPDRDGTSTYREYLTLRKGSYKGIVTNATEYVVGKKFKCCLSMRNDGIVDFDGTICVFQCNKHGERKQSVYTSNRSFKASNNPSIWSFYYSSATIKDPIEEGDRLRVFYKNKNSTEWIRAERGTTTVYSEVLLCATPEEVAESLKLSYDKTTSTLTFTSIHAIQYSVKDEAGLELLSAKVPSFETTNIDFSDYKEGKYQISFASGGDPYILNIQL